MNPFRPRARARSVHELDYAALWERGIRALLFDLDNTLGLWRAGPPDVRTAELLRRLSAAGFKLAVISNGRLSQRPEVLDFFRELGIPVIWPARKPLPAGFRHALKVLETVPHETAVIGDQILTDVLGGNLMGLYTILVPPLSPHESRFTKFNRFLERWLR